MKSRLIFFVFYCLLPIGIFAQNPHWQWAQIGNDGNYGWSTDIAVDEIGNSYVMGTFTGTLVIGSFSLISKGKDDIFWAKFDINGQAVWAKSAGGSEDDYSGGIALDQEGNLYVGSSFTDSAYYEGVQYIANGWADLCLAKYDSSGNLIWIKTWGSIYNDVSNEVIVKEGHILLTGYFGGYGGSPSVYESIDFDAITITSQGNGDVFVVKSDTAGNVIWAKNAGGKYSDRGLSAFFGSDGGVFVCGDFTYPHAFFDSIKLFSKYGPFQDMFIAKYDSGGNVLWVRGAGANDPVYGASVTSDNAGNAYVVGGSYLSSFFGFGTTTLSGDHAFIAKYDTSGSLTWAKNIGLNSNSGAYDLALDAFNNIYVTGTFEGTGTFGLDTFASNGYEDIYVNKYDSNGNHIWAAQAGGGSNDGGYGICLDNYGNILVTGYVSSSPAYFGSHSVSAVGFWDMFVAKLSTTTGLPVLPKDDETIRVYPNPASDIITVQFEMGFSEFRVYDVSGRLIESIPVSSREEEIKLDGKAWVNGIYRLQLSGKKGIASTKLIIQKQ